MDLFNKAKVDFKWKLRQLKDELQKAKEQIHLLLCQEKINWPAVQNLAGKCADIQQQMSEAEKES